MWLKSKGHRKNILGNYDYTAVTTCRARDGNRYWVQVFGKGKDQGSKGNGGNDQGEGMKANGDHEQGEGSKGNGDNDQGEGTKDSEPQNNNQPQVNDQPGGEGGGTPNPLTSFIPLNSPNSQTEIQERFLEEEKPPISYETTISISRKYDKPSMVSASTVSPTNTPPSDQDEESENMEFLFKEGEDTQKVLKKIPQNYHLSFKGNFKKYVAMKNKERIPKKDQQSTVGPGKQPEEKPKEESSKLPSMEPKFDQHKPKEKPITGQRPKPQQPIFTPQRPKESSPKQQSQIKEKLDKLLKPEHPSAPKLQQPKNKPKGVKLPDGNQVNGMFKTILDQIKKLEDKKNTEKLHSLTIDLPQIAQPTSAALSSSVGPSSSSLSVSKTTTTQPPSTSTEVIYKTVYKYKDTPESSVKPKESTEKPKESTEKPKESTETPKESTDKPKESTEKPKESSVKQDESTDKPKESTDKPKESTDKPKESTEKPKESSSIAYKTTKIGSYSIIDSESRVKTITVTVLKDSISPSSSTRSVSPSVSSVLDFIDKPGTTLDHDEENLSEFDSKVKKLFKDLIDTKKKRRLFRLAPNLEKDTESRLKDYVRKLIDSEDPIEKDGVLDCSVIDIGEPAVD
jgi:hypothetical protein